VALMWHDLQQVLMAEWVCLQAGMAFLLSGITCLAPPVSYLLLMIWKPQFRRACVQDS